MATDGEGITVNDSDHSNAPMDQDILFDGAEKPVSSISDTAQSQNPSTLSLNDITALIDHMTATDEDLPHLINLQEEAIPNQLSYPEEAVSFPENQETALLSPDELASLIENFQADELNMEVDNTLSSDEIASLVQNFNNSSSIHENSVPHTEDLLSNMESSDTELTFSTDELAKLIETFDAQSSLIPVDQETTTSDINIEEALNHKQNENTPTHEETTLSEDEIVSLATFFPENLEPVTDVFQDEALGASDTHTDQASTSDNLSSDNPSSGNNSSSNLSSDEIASLISSFSTAHPDNAVQSDTYISEDIIGDSETDDTIELAASSETNSSTIFTPITAMDEDIQASAVTEITEINEINENIQPVKSTEADDETEHTEFIEHTVLEKENIDSDQDKPKQSKRGLLGPLTKIRLQKSRKKSIFAFLHLPNIRIPKLQIPTFWRLWKRNKKQEENLFVIDPNDIVANDVANDTTENGMSVADTFEPDFSASVSNIEQELIENAINEPAVQTDPNEIILPNESIGSKDQSKPKSPLAQYMNSPAFQKAVFTSAALATLVSVAVFIVVMIGLVRMV